MVGEDFFPTVDSGMMRLHVRAPQGTRIEETERLFGDVEQAIRREIPARELDTILDDIGLPAGGTTSLALSDSPTIGDADGEILIALKEDHRPTPQYVRQLRKSLAAKFPGTEFFFQAANITNEILNFGLPAPIDVQVVGRQADANYEVAREIGRRIARIPGAVDVHVHQEIAYPEVRVNVDRTKASQVGMTQRDVANSMLISLSGSGQTAPNQWLNPRNGVSYLIVTQTPPYRLDTFDDLRRTPISGPPADGAARTATTPRASFYQANPTEGSVATSTGTSSMQLLGNLAILERRVSTAVVSHYDVQPVIDVFANVDNQDLGSVVSGVNQVLQAAALKLPRGSFVRLRGLAATMQSSFTRLGIGIVFAVLLVYLLMVVNFQSWLDPFIILTALPGALSGIVWILFVTQTTFSVPSLMGAMMTVGVATANSILVVSFANDERMAGRGALEAARAAGTTRFRPVLMTAAAMMLGMLPMAIGMGEGGEQNAPLGRAVIGGLLVATVTTLFFVPIMYSFLRRNAPVDYDRAIAQQEARAELSLPPGGSDAEEPAP
jgi:multidrug efflux pump subunit AcrB